MKRLSIIIVTYNSEKDIYDCVASIRKCSDIAWTELEVIVVDNNSKGGDAMFSKLRELYGEDIILIKNTHNGGYGQGNNVGIRQATAPVVMIMNPDVRLIEPVFKTAVDAFNADKRLGMYGMKQMLSPILPSVASFNCTYMMNGYWNTFLTGLCNRFDWYWSEYMYFSGACFYIRKSMFEEIGLFDEDVFMYGEEDDIHYRMKHKFGCRMKYNPDLHYVHLTMGRKPSLSYEKTLLDRAIFLNEKKGYSAKKTILNRLRNMNVLLMREFFRVYFGKKERSLYNMYKEYRSFLKDRLKETV